MGLRGGCPTVARSSVAFCGISSSTAQTLWGVISRGYLKSFCQLVCHVCSSETVLGNADA